MKLLPQEKHAIAPNLYPKPKEAPKPSAKIKGHRATRNIVVDWPAVTTQKHKAHWEAWESAYIALLANDMVSFQEITKRLRPITRKTGRPDRDKNAVTSRLNLLGKKHGKKTKTTIL